ncbi:MAG: hypothetical protein ABI640_13025 [Gammaproteobacteria bacterium]
MKIFDRASERCRLCNGSGENLTGVVMRVNTNICPRCGVYGTVPGSSPTYDSKNLRELTDEDRGYIRSNGGMPPDVANPEKLEGHHDRNC